MDATAIAPRTFPAYDLKPGDEITWDFRPQPLGDVTVFDAYPIAGGRRETGGLVQVVLLVTDAEGGESYRYRQVTGATVFAVR